MERTDLVPGGSSFAEIRDFLLGKYGKPKSEATSKNPELNLEGQLITWHTDNTIIELLKLAIPNQGLYRTSVTYRGKSQEAAKGVQ
jgi:hypothetical protein